MPTQSKTFWGIFWTKQSKNTFEAKLYFLSWYIKLLISFYFLTMDVEFFIISHFHKGDEIEDTHIQSYKCFKVANSPLQLYVSHF